MIDGLEYHEGLNAVHISGGVAGNVLPDECVVSVNHRFAPDRSVEEAYAHMREVFDGFEIELSDSAPAAMPGLSVPAAAAFLEAVGGTANPKFGWTDVARFSGAGRPGGELRPGRPAPGAQAGRVRPARAHRHRRAPAAHLAGGGLVSNHVPERYRGRTVMRRDQIDSSTTDQRLLDSRDSTDWLHTDPWRVLRIQSEFVEGFGTLAELGPAISVFGSARTSAEDPSYAAAEAIGTQLVAAGFAVITGGGPGVMEAANKGACEAGGISVGLGIELPFEAGLNRYVDRGLNFRYFFARKTMFVKYAQGFIVLPGRLRHLRRAVRGAHPRADPEGHVVPDRAGRHGLLVRPRRLAPLHGAGRRQGLRGRPGHVPGHRRRRRGGRGDGAGAAGPHERRPRWRRDAEDGEQPD